jgi:hypothetical protein
MGAFTFWCRLCLKLQFRCRAVGGGGGGERLAPPPPPPPPPLRQSYGPFLQFGDYDHLDARLDIAVDLDGYLVGTKGLYGLLQAYATPV